MRKFIFLSIVLLAACKPDKQDDPKPEAGFIAKGKGVFICNEGNFQFGNASVSFYNTDKNEVNADVFKSINQRPLGDVCQSMMIDGDLAYIVVNNSSRVEVVKLPEFTSVRTISNFPSPRYMVKAGADKAYVSNYYSNHISIVNTSTGVISGQITCYGWTEQMLFLNGKVYVVNVKSNYLYIIDPPTDQLSDSIDIGGIASGIAVDKNQDIWVTCNADKPNSKPPFVKRINVQSKSVVQSIQLPDMNHSPASPCMNGEGDSLYFSYNGIYKMAVSSASAPPAAFIPQGSKIFYSMGVNPSNGDIYVSDAIDYVQKGKVYRYYRGGALRSEFNAGIIPGNFVFYR